MKHWYGKVACPVPIHRLANDWLILQKRSIANVLTNPNLQLDTATFRKKLYGIYTGQLRESRRLACVSLMEVFFTLVNAIFFIALGNLQFQMYILSTNYLRDWKLNL